MGVFTESCRLFLFSPPSRLLLTRMAGTSISLEDEFGRTVFAGWMFPMAGRLAARVALRLLAGTCRTGTGHHLCKQAFSPGAVRRRRGQGRPDDDDCLRREGFEEVHH